MATLDDFLPHCREMQGFLTSIKQNPQDETTRLIFADWLEERGDPRSELIRIQCEMKGGPLYLERFRKLDLRQQQLSDLFREWISSNPSWQVRENRVSLGLLTIRIGLIWEQDYKLGNLADKEWWPWVDTLEVDRTLTSDYESLLTSEQLRNLSFLNLRGCLIGTEGAITLANSDHVAHLSSLGLGDNQIGPRGAESLALSENFSRLRFLGLRQNDLQDYGLAALASSPYLQNVSYLGLSSNNITSGGVKVLAKSPTLHSLSLLDLRSNAIDDEGVKTLVESKHLKNLTHLFLVNNLISEQGRRLLFSRFEEQCKVCQC